MSALILMVLILLAAVLLKRKITTPAENYTTKTKFSTFKTIDLQQDNLLLPHNCKPYEVIFKENYIAVYSKKCNIIKTFRMP